MIFLDFFRVVLVARIWVATNRPPKGAEMILLMSKTKNDQAQARRLSLIIAVITGESPAMQIAGDAPDQLYRTAPAAPVDGIALDFSAVGGC